MLKFTRDSVCTLVARRARFVGAAMVLGATALLAVPGGALAQGGGGGGASGAPRVQPMRTASVDQPAVAEARFDLRFEGGTVADYLEAIQEASGKRNIVAMANTDRVPMPRVILDGVNTMAAVLLLDNMRVRNEAGSMFEVNVRSTMEVIRVSVSVLEEREGALARHDAAQRDTAVHGLAGMLSEGGYTVDAILSAIEVALDMAGDSGARLRYHEETRMLFVYGTDLEHMTVRSVLEELKSQAQVRLGSRMMSEEERIRFRLEELDAQIERDKDALGALEVGSYNPIQNRITRAKQRMRTIEDQIVAGDAGPMASEELAMEMRAVERATIEIERVEAEMRDYRLRLATMLSERDNLWSQLGQPEQE